MIWRAEIATRMAGVAVLWAAGTALVAMVLLLAAPRLVGGQSFAVLSDSMHGAVDTGDEVVVLPHAAAEIERGQIVAFDDPNGSGRLFQHRVLSVVPHGEALRVTTKGDANNVSETWQVDRDGEVGRVVAVVPKLGYVLDRIASPLGTRLLVVIPALALMLLALYWIWRPAQDPDLKMEASAPRA